MTVKEALAVLEVSGSATPEEIDRAYRDLGIVWQPDQFPKNSELQRKAQDKLKQINAAYAEILKSGAFAGSHAPTPPLAPKTQPTQAMKPEPIPLQSPNLESSQAQSSSATSILIPNSHKLDLAGVFAHLSQFGRWGIDKRKGCVIANWSWHTVVRIYANGEDIKVTASPRFRTMIVFGLIPMCLIASTLKGHGGLAALEAASGFGLGWLIWWMFFLSDILERMQKFLVATTPPTDPNVNVARGETPAADSTPDQSVSVPQIRLVEDGPCDEESQRIDIEVQLTAERPSSSIGGDGSDRVQVNTKSLDVPATDAKNSYSEQQQHDRIPAWSYVLGGGLLFGFGLAIGLAFGTRSGSVNLREEYDRRLKAHLAGYEDDPLSMTVATLGFYSDVRLSPFDQRESADQTDSVKASTIPHERDGLSKSGPPSSSNHATWSDVREDVREIAPLGTLPNSDEKPLADGFTDLARSKMDALEKESNLQLRADQATRALAFGAYTHAVEAARRADQRTGENSDRLWEAAIESLNRAVELDPSFVAPRIVLACIHFYYRNEHETAKQLLAEAIRTEPTNAEAHYYLAEVQYDDGNEEEAMREVNLAVSLDRNLAPAYRLRSRLYETLNEPAKAAGDLFCFEALAGELDTDYVFPWTLRSVHFRSKESGLTLQYSSAWYPFESMAESSELRLIRHDNSRVIAFSLIYLGEVFHPGMNLDEMVVDVFEGMREAEPSLANAEIVQLGVGELNLDRQSVHWLDYEIKSPPLLANRSRIFTLEHAGKVWSIRFSTRNDVLFRQYLPSAEEVIRSISFN